MGYPRPIPVGETGHDRKRNRESLHIRAIIDELWDNIQLAKLLRLYQYLSQLILLAQIGTFFILSFYSRFALIDVSLLLLSR